MTTYREIRRSCSGHPTYGHVAITYTDGNQQTICYDYSRTYRFEVKQMDFRYICNNLFGIDHKCKHCNFTTQYLYFPDNVLANFNNGIYTIYKIIGGLGMGNIILFKNKSLDETLDYLRDRYFYLLMPTKVANKNE